MANLRKLGRKIINETYPDLNEILFESRAARWGRLIMARRIQQGLTQKQLAEKANVGEKTLYRVEGGNSNVTLDKYDALFDALGISKEESGDALKKTDAGNKHLVGSH